MENNKKTIYSKEEILASTLFSGVEKDCLKSLPKNTSTLEKATKILNQEKKRTVK